VADSGDITPNRACRSEREWSSEDDSTYGTAQWGDSPVRSDESQKGEEEEGSGHDKPKQDQQVVPQFVPSSSRSPIMLELQSPDPTPSGRRSWSVGDDTLPTEKQKQKLHYNLRSSREFPASGTWNSSLPRRSVDRRGASGKQKDSDASSRGSHSVQRSRSPQGEKEIMEKKKAEHELRKMSPVASRARPLLESDSGPESDQQCQKEGGMCNESAEEHPELEMTSTTNRRRKGLDRRTRQTDGPGRQADVNMSTSEEEEAPRVRPIMALAPPTVRGSSFTMPHLTGYHAMQHVARLWGSVNKTQDPK